MEEWNEIEVKSPPQPRHFHVMVEHEGIIYLFGGKSNGYHSSLHIFDQSKLIFNT